MSEVLAQLEKKGGGEEKETILWSNPNTSVDFPYQNVTLSDSISNYSKIGFYCQYHKTDNTMTKVVMATEDITTWQSPYLNNGFMPTVAIAIKSGNSSTEWGRWLAKTNDTTIFINDTAKITTGSGSKNNGYIIPVKIVGIK